MLKVFLILFLGLYQASADDLLQVLDGGDQQSDGLSIEKKTTIFKAMVPSPTAEQNIFFQFLERGEATKALYQWPSAFEGKSFAQSDSGQALYGYLLFKNGLRLIGLEYLFSANPTNINPKLIELWRGNMQTNEGLWKLADVQWSAQWTEVFGLPAEVAVTSRRFEEELTQSKLEELLRKTTSNTWERSWTEWRFVTTLLLAGEDIKAAKLLKHLQGVKENNPISEDLMNITAARMLYQNGYLQQSLDYYQKVPKASDYWFEALEEMGWAELRLGRPQNTLAHMQTLLVKSLEPDVGPETFYLSTLANLKVCDYQEVSNNLKEFRTRFQSKAKVLLSLKDKPDAASTQKLFSLLKKGRTSMPELGEFATQLPRYSTRDEQLFFLVQRQDTIEKEANTAKELYSRSLSEGTSLVGFQAQMERFNKTMRGRTHQAFSASLNRVKTLAGDEIQEISSVLKKMQIVEAELIQQLALADRVIADSKGQEIKVKNGTTGAKSQDTLSFPVGQEIWFDELSNFKVDVAKGCQSGKGKTL